MTTLRLGEFSTRQFTIPAAGVLAIDTDADQLLVTELTGGDGTIQLQLNHGPPGDAWKGFEATGTIRHVQITNPSASLAVVVTVALVHGLAIRDRRVSVVGGAVPVVLASYASFASLPDVNLPALATTLVLASDPVRQVARIANPASNPREVRIGGPSAAAGEGFELNPGDSIDLGTTAAIHAFNPHTAAMAVSLLVFGS